MKFKKITITPKKILLNVLLAICVGVFIYSGYNLLDIYKDNYDEKVEIESIKEIVGIPSTDDSQSLEEFSVNFSTLSAINSDIVGWIVVENTAISYPIVQGDDNEYYLDHTFENKENYAGAIFMDYRQSSDFSDLNTFIYGHNVYHGTMFAELAYYTQTAYFNEHPYIYLYTPNGNYKLEVFSAYTALATSDSYRLNFSNTEDFLSYVDYVTSLSYNQREGVVIEEGDNIITLYTCSYENGETPENSEDGYIEERYFIHAKVIADLS